MRRIAIVFSTVLVSFAISAQVAFADSCVNVSRAAPTSTGTAIFKGNWVWLPSVGASFEAWAFVVPGSDIAEEMGFPSLPGANGNFTNGKTESLLGVSANCPPGANRQTTQGIQSGCH